MFGNVLWMCMSDIFQYIALSDVAKGCPCWCCFLLLIVPPSNGLLTCSEKAQPEAFSSGIFLFSFPWELMWEAKEAAGCWSDVVQWEGGHSQITFGRLVTKSWQEYRPEARRISWNFSSPSKENSKPVLFHPTGLQLLGKERKEKYSAKNIPRNRPKLSTFVLLQKKKIQLLFSSPKH